MNQVLSSVVAVILLVQSGLTTVFNLQYRVTKLLAANTETEEHLSQTDGDGGKYLSCKYSVLFNVHTYHVPTLLS